MEKDAEKAQLNPRHNGVAQHVNLQWNHPPSNWARVNPPLLIQQVEIQTEHLLKNVHMPRNPIFLPPGFRYVRYGGWFWIKIKFYSIKI